MLTRNANNLTYRVWNPWTSMPNLNRNNRASQDIVKASGSYLYTSDGRRLIDGSAGLWNVNLGYGREDIGQAISEQIHQLSYLLNIEMRSQVANELANELLKYAPHIGRVMFHSTGTAAVEAAILLVRQYFKLIDQPQKYEVISLEGGYHGCSLLTTAIAGTPFNAKWFEPLPPGFHQIPAPQDEETARQSIEALNRLIEDRGAKAIASFIFEPVQALAGVIVPPDWWASEVIRICHQHGIKVIADEVVTAFGRIGAWFACAEQPVDIIVVGKGLSCGYVPIAASMYSEELFEPFNSQLDAIEFRYGSTMDGCPVACAAGLAVLRAIESEGVVEHAARISTKLIEKLQPLKQLSMVNSIRATGVMVGMPMLEPGSPDKPMSKPTLDRIHQALRAAGLFILFDPSILILLPPLTITEQECDELVEILSKTLVQFDSN